MDFLPSTKKRWRARCFVFVDEDAVLLTAALKSRFPTFRIVADGDIYKREDIDPPDKVQSLGVPYCDTLSAQIQVRQSMQLG